MHVIVIPYQAIWPRIYEQEKMAIQEILQDEIVDIYHIGSTAVSQLAAKPIIDIMVAIKNISAVDQYNSQFDKLGYEPMGEYGIKGRRSFRKGKGERTHHIHIFESTNQYDIKRHLAVRDYLRNHPDVAQAYGLLKQQLALQYPFDIEGYCDGKNAFVKKLEQDALSWYFHQS